MYDAPLFLFITTQIGSLSLSRDLLKISLIYVFPASKNSSCKLIKQSNQPIHTLFSHLSFPLLWRVQGPVPVLDAILPPSQSTCPGWILFPHCFPMTSPGRWHRLSALTGPRSFSSGVHGSAQPFFARHMREKCCLVTCYPPVFFLLYTKLGEALFLE